MRRTLSEHQTAINGYVGRVAQLRQGYEHLSTEVSHVQGMEFADPTPRIMKGCTEAVEAVRRFKGVVKADDFNRGEMRNGLLLFVRDLAMLRDFEKDLGTLTCIIDPMLLAQPSPL